MTLGTRTNWEEKKENYIRHRESTFCHLDKTLEFYLCLGLTPSTKVNISSFVSVSESDAYLAMTVIVIPFLTREKVARIE